MTAIEHGWKLAKDLEPGDRCEGPGIFVLTGVVESLEEAAADGCVRINWRGGTFTDRPSDFEVRVHTCR